MSALRDLLLVEDEPVVQDATRRILEPEGLRLDLTGNGREAATRLRDHRFRVLLCDLMLPDASGFDLISLAHDTDPTIQVIVVTGYATLDNAIDSFRLGAFDFIPKPFDADEMRGVVARALAFHNLEAARVKTHPSAGRSAESDPTSSAYRLGRHAWVTIDPDGSATLGGAETFASVLHRLDSIDLPALGDHITQGRELALIVSGNDRVHRVWAPLSGKVIAVNSQLETEHDLFLGEPFGAGWLVKIVPESPKEELSHLQRIPHLGSPFQTDEAD